MHKFKIYIHPSFLLLLLIGLYGGFIEEVFSFSIIILLHELGHLIAAKICKVRYYAIHLTIIGCMIDLEDFSNINFFKKIFINTAGVIINLILIGLFSISNNQILIDYNKLMIFINLLPIPPLDGYKIVYSVFTLIFDDEYTIDCMFYLSMIFLVILTILILIFKLYGYLLIISFLGFKTIMSKVNDKNRKIKHLIMLKKMQYS